MREFITETVMIFSKKSKNDFFLLRFLFTFIYSSKLEMINILLYFYHELLACAYTKIHVRHFTFVQIPDNADRVSLHGVKQPRDWSQSAHFRSCANNEFIVQ